MSTRALVLVVLAQGVVIALLAAQLGSGESRTSVPDGVPPSVAAGTDPVPRVVPQVPPEETESLDPKRRFAEPARPVYRADDPVGIVVQGTVRNAPSEGRRPPRIVFRSGTQVLSVFCEADGGYALAGLSPGSWRVRCEAEGTKAWEQDVQFTEEAIQRLDITLEFAQIVKVLLLGPKGDSLRKELWETRKVNLSPDPYAVATDAPLPDVLPAITHSRRWGLGVGTWVDPRTGEDVKRGVLGELHLASPPPVHVQVLYGQAVLARRVVEAGQEEMVFRIGLDELMDHTATVRMRLLDASTGQPLPGARLTIGNSNRRASADPDGRVEAAGLSPGFVEVHHQVEGYEQPWHYVRAGPGETVDLGDVSLWPLSPIRGTVLGPDGQPAACRMSWHALDGLDRSMPLYENRIADADGAGRFELWGTGRRRYLVRARDRDGRFGHAVIDATGGPVTDAVVRLHEGTTVTAEHAFDPVQSFLLTVRDGDRLPLFSRLLVASQERTRLSLPSGTYVAEIHEPGGGLVRSFALQVGAGPVTFTVP